MHSQMAEIDNKCSMGGNFSRKKELVGKHASTRYLSLFISFFRTRVFGFFLSPFKPHTHTPARQIAAP